jgi:hypothetical protein
MSQSPLQAPSGNAARIFTFRAVRALILGVLAMGAVAWIVSVPAVLCAALAAGIAALLTARAARISRLVIVTLTLAVVGGFTGSLLFGHGPTVLRVLAGAVASLAAGPWGVVLGFVVRARAIQRG